MLRVKLRVIPYDEKLCLLTPINSCVHDLKAEAIEALQVYAVYREYLKVYAVHLELEIDKEAYGVADHYAVKDVYTPRDTFVVSFIEHQYLVSRPSIHVPSRPASKADSMTKAVSATDNNNNENHQNNVRPPHAQQPPPQSAAAAAAMGAPPQSLNVSTNNIADIQQWIGNELRTFGTIHAIYRCDYASFVAKLQNVHSASIQRMMHNMMQQNSEIGIETFLSRLYDVHCVETATQHWVEWEIPSGMQQEQEQDQDGGNRNENENQNEHKNETENHNGGQVNDDMDDDDDEEPDDDDADDADENAKNADHQNDDDNIRKPSPKKTAVERDTEYSHDHSELPATPSSATDHEDEDDDGDEGGDEDEDELGEELEDSARSNESGNDEDEKIGELDMNLQAVTMSANQLQEPSTESEEMASSQVNVCDNLRDVLPQFLWLSYKQLVAQMKARRVPWRLAKFVEISALERAVKCKFRENTVHEFSACELDYVCFRQLLQMECTAWMEVRIFECHAQMMDGKRRDYYGAELLEEAAIESADPAEIATFVVIRAASDVRQNYTQPLYQEALDDEEEDDDDDDGDEEILRDIEYLKQCNVVHKMSADDVYFHIKLVHCCTRSVAELQHELTALNSNNSSEKPEVDQEMEPEKLTDAIEQVACKLRTNGIDGAGILNMKWSDWAKLSQLDRCDADHQDFVEDLVLDFFFPFNIGEQLLNQIVSLRKPPMKRSHNKNASRPTSIFENAQIRSKFSLCLDYALYDHDFPILQCLVKLAQFEDMQFLFQVHKHLSVDRVVGPYNSMHIAAWKGKFKILAEMTMYGGNPLITNNEHETALEAGRKHPAKLKWFVEKYPKFTKYVPIKS